MPICIMENHAQFSKQQCLKHALYFIFMFVRHPHTLCPIKEPANCVSKETANRSKIMVLERCDTKRPSSRAVDYIYIHTEESHRFNVCDRLKFEFARMLFHFAKMCV